MLNSKEESNSMSHAWSMYNDVSHSASGKLLPLRMDERAPYVVPGLPIEVHIHGINDMDFSADCRLIDVDRIQECFEEEGIMGIPTIFLNQGQLSDFCDLLRRFSEKKRDGEFSHIIGLALEGPLLLSQGGTPEVGNWSPTFREWEAIAQCGHHGLQYVVLSPDLDDIHQLQDIIALLLSHGVKPAIGHCRHDRPDAAVQGIETMIETAQSLGFGRGSDAILTDHLFNDMPRLFKHAWRTAQERRLRSSELPDQHLENWSFDRLEHQVGPVPASLMRHAKDGLIALFLNFDGEHVDIQVAKRAYELLGPDHIMAMTDRVEMNRLGKRLLTKSPIGSLWYQEKGVVAAGSSTIDDQMNNMRKCGIPEKDIWKLCSFTAACVFDIINCRENHFPAYSCVDRHGMRSAHPA